MRFPSVRSTVAGAAFCAAAGSFAAPASAAAPAGLAAVPFTAIAGSARVPTGVPTGALNRAKMSIEVVLAPRSTAQLSALLANVSNPNSANYKHWLQKGQFKTLFAPSAAQIAAVAGYLQAAGLTVGQSSSPFLVRASGSSSAVAAAFRTNLRTYRDARGVAYFSNDSAVQVPAAFAAGVYGVLGLSSTARNQPQLVMAGRHSASQSTSCEAPYPTAAQIIGLFIDGINVPFGYGGGPGCTGLTPSQVNSIYGAPNVGRRGKGAGATLGVFEQSAYQHSDIATWAHTFLGPKFTPPLVDITVDGGPLAPVCPTLDLCPPQYNGYWADAEVDLDIEEQLAVAPAASHVLVYNAPTDITGQTTLDNYLRIADDDLADVVSSSYGNCENVLPPALVQAENVFFEQMALQGQSMFAAAGDNGAFSCLENNGSSILNALDPSAQPWVTSVGGTSLESFNPGTAPHPAYPAGVETVWNPGDLCNSRANEGGESGFFWCVAVGSGGGGNSQYWARPFFQFGPGIANRYSTQCALASGAAPCRETPDVSANADAFTPYAVYCTGSAALPFSQCASFGGGGWLAVGGTSASSPVLSAIIADRDGFQATRTGPASALLYWLYNFDPHGYFNDITGIGQTTNNNGFFPTVPGYDLATGVGTPKMAPIITGFPRK